MALSTTHTLFSQSLFRPLALSLIIMHLLSAAVAALSTAQLVLGGPLKSRSPYAVKETHHVPPTFHKVGIPHPDHKINLKIAMKNNRFHELERHLYEVSDPLHERYGKHLTSDEVDELVKPTEEASALVDEWLREHGILAEDREYTSGKQWITISVPVSQVEEMLQTKYAVYQHEQGDTLVRATSWSLPEHLHEHIATIQPTTAFMRAAGLLKDSLITPGEIAIQEAQNIQLESTSADPVKACNFSAVTPQCLRVLYKTDQYKPKALGKNQIGFTNYLGEVTNRSDANLFLQQFRPEAAQSAFTYKEISIAGGPIDNGTTGAGVEALLDVETILGQVYPTNVTSYSTGGSPPFIPDINTPTNTNEPYLVWLNYIRSQRNPPQTVSTSYGDDEQTVPQSYAETVCQGFAELGARGISLLFSSGDNGVGKDGTCLSNDGKNTTMFLPSFPASCPYITAVGGTRDYPEVVAFDTRNGYVSGSGFSNYFKRPVYQALAVPPYIKSLGGKFNGLYNQNGRAYPDLAAQSYRYVVTYAKRNIFVDGTSASCPTTSSIISLVNDALIAAGRPPLGFLNPWLYAGVGQKAFTDVVSGNSSGCSTTGFPAQKGWDAATGWGTPNFLKILQALVLKP